MTDNVAHDLRTPLTHIRSRLEKALDCPRDGERDQAVIMDMLTDLDNVLRIFTSVTRIAQIEASDRTVRASGSSTSSQLPRKSSSCSMPRLKEAGVNLKVVGEPSAYLNGDRDLLFDAAHESGGECNQAWPRQRRRCRSLLSRAWTPSMFLSPMTVPVFRSFEEIEHVTKRFYRLERSRSTPGNGLGLSLVAAVARLHGVRIAMEDNSPGLRVRLSFSGCKRGAMRS